jgi:hypothetical protein
VHGFLRAQGVRGDAPVAALYERRNIFRSGPRRSQTAATEDFGRS